MTTHLNQSFMSSVQQAEEALRNGQSEPAEKILSIALQQDPLHAKANELMGMLYLQRQDMTQAQSFLERSVKQTDTSAFAHYLLGSLYMVQQNYAAAALHLQQGVNMGAHFFEALHNLGTALVNTGQLSQALGILDRATALRDHPDTWHCKGVVLQLLTQHAAALDCFKKVISLDDQHAKGWSDLGTSLMLNKQMDQSKLALEKALSLADTPQDQAGILYRLSMLDGGKQAPDRTPSAYAENLFDQFANTFDETLVKHLDYTAPQILFNAISALRSNDDWQVLDLGCGTGLCGQLFKAKASRLVGVDLSNKMLEKADQKGFYDALIKRDIIDFLSTPTHIFDVVIAADVFIYLGRLDDVFSGIKQCMAPSGHLCFSIEHDEDAPNGLILGTTGRYAHSMAYIRDLADQHGMVIRDSFTQALRTDNGQPVPAMYFVLENSPI